MFVCLQQQFVLTSTDNAQALAMGEGGIAIIAVKPYMLKGLAGQCVKQFQKMRMIISVLAGVKIEDISKAASFGVVESEMQPKNDTLWR